MTHYGFQGQNGFTFGNDSSAGISKISLFPRRRKESHGTRRTGSTRRQKIRGNAMLIYKILSALLEYPDKELFENLPEISKCWMSRLIPTWWNGRR